MKAGVASSLTQRPWFIASAFGLAAILWRIPFIFRYDLNFQTEYGVCYLMSKRILIGELPVYFWESDYMGTLPNFVTAALFAVFGPSIELSTFVSVFSYAAAVALGVEYVRRHFDLGRAMAAGLFAAVGVPYTLHYCAQPAGGGYLLGPLMGIALVWVGALIHERGWSFGRCLAAGLLIGHCWYYNKQCIIGIATVGVVFLADSRGRKLIKELVTTRSGLSFVAAFVVGYLPEIVYRLSHPVRHNFSGLASTSEMGQNLYWFVRTFPAYFNGDPLGRIPEGVHYLQHNPKVESLPQSLVDWLGIAIAWIVAVLIVRRLVRSWKNRNVPVLLLAAYVVLNALAIVVSKAAVGEYYAPKRYLFTSAIILLLWAGIECWEFAQRKKWPLAVLLALLVPVSVFHHLQMLRMPDELRDYRVVVKQLQDAGYHYGVTWYTYAFSLTALSDERVIFAVLDYNKHEPYERLVAQQDTLVLVFPSQAQGLPESASFFNRVYKRDGPSHLVGELAWTVFRRVPTS